MSNLVKGREGERRAAEFLKSRGYEVIGRNVRGPRGEIDLIARRADRMVFCEVKNWDGMPEEGLEQSIDRRKRRRIIHTAKSFLARNPEYIGGRMSFDVIFISCGLSRLKHIENAFGENDD